MKSLISCNLSGIKKSTVSNYVTWLKALWREPGMNPHLQQAINDGIGNLLRTYRTLSPRPSVSLASAGAEALISSLTNPAYPVSDYKSACRKLVAFICSGFDGTCRVELMYDDEQLMSLIAASALFAPPQIVEDVVLGRAGCKENKSNKGNDFASWHYCKYQRKTPSQKKGGTFTYPDPKNPGIPLTGRYDDNTQANLAIKTALLKAPNTFLRISEIKDFQNYTACHIWDGQSSSGTNAGSTVYDNRFHTSLTNIVLIPSVLAGITDHNPVVSECLRIRSHDLYGHIPGLHFPGTRPDAPSWYPRLVWR